MGSGVVGVAGRQSVYTLYNENGESALFWMRKHNWNQTIAYVLDIQGMVSGELDEFGKPPYYANPKPNCAYFLDGELYHSQINDPTIDGRLVNIGVQDGAGSSNWELLETPEWWREEMASELNLPFWEEELPDSDNEQCHCIEPMKTDHFCECDCVCHC